MEHALFRCIHLDLPQLKPCLYCVLPIYDAGQIDEDLWFQFSHSHNEKINTYSIELWGKCLANGKHSFLLFSQSFPDYLIESGS